MNRAGYWTITGLIAIAAIAATAWIYRNELRDRIWPETPATEESMTAPSEEQVRAIVERQQYRSTRLLGRINQGERRLAALEDDLERLAQRRLTREMPALRSDVPRTEGELAEARIDAFRRQYDRPAEERRQQVVDRYSNVTGVPSDRIDRLFDQ